MNLLITVTNSRPNATSSKEKTSPLKPAYAQVPRGPVNEWTIEEVIQFISANDSSLAAHATIFREHVSL